MLKTIIIIAAVALVAFFAWPYLFPPLAEEPVHDPAYEPGNGGIVDSIVNTTLPSAGVSYASTIQADAVARSRG